MNIEDSAVLLNNNLEVIKKFKHEDTSSELCLYGDKYLVLIGYNYAVFDDNSKFLQFYDLNTLELLKTIYGTDNCFYIENDSFMTTKYSIYQGYYPFLLKGLLNLRNKKYMPTQYYDVKYVNDYYLCTTVTEKDYPILIKDENYEEQLKKIILDSDLNVVELSFIKSDEPIKLDNVIYNKYTNNYLYIMLNELNKMYYLYDNSGNLLFITYAKPVEFVSRSVLTTQDILNGKTDNLLQGYIVFNELILETKPGSTFIAKSPIDNIFYLRETSVTQVIEDSGKSLNVIVSGNCDKLVYSKDCDYFIVEKSGKYGVLSLDGEVILDTIYNFVNYIERDYILCGKDGLQNIFDMASMKFKFDWKYSSTNKYHDTNYYRLYTNESSKIIDSTGKVVISGDSVIYIDDEHFGVQISDDNYLFYTSTKGEPSNWAKYDINVLSNLDVIPKEYNNEISSWALESVNKVSSIRLLVGDTNGKFNPKGNASREQAYVIIHRLYKLK